MKPRKVPQRTCVGCRSVRSKRELVRIVRTPDKEVTVDATGQLAGRGAYVCPDEDCLELAYKGKRLERALQQPVPEDVLTRLSQLLEQSR